MDIKQGGGGGGTLKETSNTNKMPTFTMRHGGIGNTLKEVDTFEGFGKKCARFSIPYLFHAGAFHVKVEAVDLFPHFRTDLFAYLARILAGTVDAGDDRGVVGRVKGEGLCDGIGVTRVLFGKRRDT